MLVESANRLLGIRGVADRPHAGRSRQLMKESWPDEPMGVGLRLLGSWVRGETLPSVDNGARATSGEKGGEWRR
jgi:hypothetical protein